MQEIKNTTIYSEEKIKKFFEIYYFERMKMIRVITNILIIIMIIYFFTYSKKQTIDFITLIIGLFGILEINTNMIPRLNYYKVKKSKNSVLNMKLKYIFKKNNFELTNKKTEYIDYNTLYKVIETEDSYYLFINKRRALLVDKTSLKEEEISDLTKRFKDNVSTYKHKK